MTLVMNLQNLQQGNGMLLMTKTIESMVMEMKMVELLSLRQKLFNLFCVIILMLMRL